MLAPFPFKKFIFALSLALLSLNSSLSFAAKPDPKNIYIRFDEVFDESGNVREHYGPTWSIFSKISDEKKSQIQNCEPVITYILRNEYFQHFLAHKKFIRLQNASPYQQTMPMPHPGGPNQSPATKHH